MITAYSYGKIEKAIESSKQQMSSEAENAKFVFVGVDEHHIYFNAISPLDKITYQQQADLIAKTIFELLYSSNIGIVKMSFKMSY